jgi:hypothetical protein
VRVAVTGVAAPLMTALLMIVVIWPDFEYVHWVA